MGTQYTGRLRNVSQHIKNGSSIARFSDQTVDFGHQQANGEQSNGKSQTRARQLPSMNLNTL